MMTHQSLCGKQAIWCAGESSAIRLPILCGLRRFEDIVICDATPWETQFAIDGEEFECGDRLNFRMTTSSPRPLVRLEPT
jgi:hypothetical protein